MRRTKQLNCFLFEAKKRAYVHIGHLTFVLNLFFHWWIDHYENSATAIMSQNPFDSYTYHFCGDYMHIGIFHCIHCCGGGGGGINTLTVFSIGKFNLSILHEKTTKREKIKKENGVNRSHTYPMHCIQSLIYCCVLWYSFFFSSELYIALSWKNTHQKHIFDCLCSAAMPNWKYVKFCAHL